MCDVGPNNKKCRLEVRLSEDEKQAIAANARISNLSVSRYVVERCAYDVATFDLKNVPGHAPSIEIDSDHNDTKRYLKQARSTPSSGSKAERLFVRVSADEKDLITERADKANLTISDYVVMSSLGATINVIQWEGEDDLRKALQELMAQGRNLNQIAYGINRLNQIAWQDGVDASLLNELMKGISDDNERTRAHINDAIKQFVATVAKITATSKAR